MFLTKVLVYFSATLGMFSDSTVLAQPGSSAHRPKLSDWNQVDSRAEEIQRLFKAKEASIKDVSDLLKALEVPHQSLLQNFQKNTAFQRNEIESEKVVNLLILWLQVSLLDFRLQVQKGEETKAWKNLNSWFLFAADLAYEESSLIGLKLCAVFRSLILDEMENLDEAKKKRFAYQDNIRGQLLTWAAPWPLDRVFLSEARRVIQGPKESIVRNIATELQKNPYRPISHFESQMKKLKPEEKEFLAKLWTEKDVENLRRELHRLGKIQIDWLQLEFQRIKGVRAKAQGEFIQMGLLKKEILDYQTGRPFTL